MVQKKERKRVQLDWSAMLCSWEKRPENACTASLVQRYWHRTDGSPEAWGEYHATVAAAGLLEPGPVGLKAPAEQDEVNRVVGMYMGRM
jgi:hypothetical protein